MEERNIDKLLFESAESAIAEIESELEKIDESTRKKIRKEIGVLPLRKFTIFPYQIAPILISSEKSVKLIDEAVSLDKLICAVTIKNENKEEINAEDLYQFGTVCKIVKMLRLPSNSIRIVVQGIARAQIVEYISNTPYIKAKIEIPEEIITNEKELQALQRNAIDIFNRITSYLPQFSEELKIIISNINEPSKLADFISSNINLSTAERQELLEHLDINQRFERLLFFLNRELELLELGAKIQNRIKSELDEKNREFLLRQELEAIKKELGESDEVLSEINELKEKVKKANMPEEVEKEALRELERMAKMSPGFAEYTVSRTYVEWLIDMPWSVVTEDNLDLKRVKEFLDEDHYNLEKVKERIIEYLAVRKLKSDVKGPILCFVGPPGVGKTSLGQSIAKAMNRKFVRISLGGIRDESEIRGHRRTYVGALPGRIIQGIKNAGSKNPVFMLDEIDKIGVDFRGDPAAALLEVLDPQQNNKFVDHYLDVPFDLSKVFFITTANIIDTIPPALLDRMEVIRLPGYTLEEKINIAIKYLIPRQLKENGISEAIKFTKNSIKKIILEYTKEAGVRNLEREISSVIRKIARRIVEGKRYPLVIKASDIPKFLGQKRFFSEIAERINKPGIATGLAWTSAGGSVLFIESALMSGKGNLKLTGQLGDVMKESANIALSYLHSNADKYGIPSEVFEKNDFHIHVPEGATPKDGPSAGVTILASLYSLLKNKKVNSETAMTGEITLRGKILPVGGIKEKVLAAKEAGIKNVIMPKLNEKDLDEIDKKIRAKLNFIFVDNVDELLNNIF
jgi:ATP-dependent Lon protease